MHRAPAGTTTKGRAMTEPSHLSDSERLAAALKRIRGVEVTEAQVRAHVMRPPHLDGVSSDRGRLDLSERPESAVETSEALAEAHLHYRLDVDGFIDSVESALGNEVAGYSMRPNEHGTAVRMVDWD